MVSKKKVVGLVLVGGALPLILTITGLPNYLSWAISLSVSCCIDTLVIYKTIKWLKPKLFALVR